jgi:hypothetical protein
LTRREEQVVSVILASAQFPRFGRRLIFCFVVLVSGAFGTRPDDLTRSILLEPVADIVVSLIPNVPTSSATLPGSSSLWDIRILFR